MRIKVLADVRVGDDRILALSIREGTLLTILDALTTLAWPASGVSFWIVTPAEPDVIYRVRDARDPEQWQEPLAELERELRAAGDARSFLAELVTRAPLDSLDRRRFPRSGTTGFPVGMFLELSGTPKSWWPLRPRSRWS